jgi:hypothetical protein
MTFKRMRSPYPEFYQPYGGHMPFPPADCEQLVRSFVAEASGIRWIDNNFCSEAYCPRARRCERRIAYRKDDHAEWHKEAARLAEVRKGRDGA